MPPTARALPVYLALLTAGCPGGDATLVVEVLTNYRAGVEFDGAVVSVHRGDDTELAGAPVETGARAGVGPRAGGPTPFRAGEITGLPPGTYLVVARLFRGNAEVGRGRVLVTTADGARSVTVLVTSECDGVVCPGSGDPALTACLAGRCVDPRCGPEATEFCPAPVCATDDECVTGGPACVRGLCLSGVCASFADDERCAGGACDRDLGCTGEVVDAGPEDAGPRDAGSDAGLPDAGVDAGVITPPFVEVAAGVDHTCARTADGEVWCWGGNGDGQLGDGTTTRRLRPVMVPALTGVEQLALGWRFSCARRESGVLCWGWSEWGQAGTAGGRVTTPSAIGGLSGTLVELVAGDNHACARTDAGAVRCWGRGDQGQRGDGSTLLFGVSAMTYRVPETSVGMGAGQLHTCVIGESGTLRCAGRNGEGQLGDGTTTRPTNAVATLLPSTVIAVDGGFSHTCALLAASRVVSCFGENSRGELGDGTFDDRPTPMDIAGFTGVLELSVGWGHACVRRADGLSCWGRNDDGQVGDGTTTSRPSPTLLPGTTSITQISAGGTHTCALRSDGVVLCWGANDQGQLGDGTTTPRATPGPVP